MQQNNNKVLYIARPKQQALDATINAENALLNNKEKGKPFIAFPKVQVVQNNKVAVPIKMKEGLFIAYPKSQQQAPQITGADNRIGKIFIAENYLAPVFGGNTIALPCLPKRKKQARQQRSFGLALMQIFKLKIS